MENRENDFGSEPMAGPEEGRIERMKERTRETLEHARDRLAAGAAGATEMGRTAMTGARDRATKVAEFVREAESNEELKGAVTERTEHSLDRAASALTRAAPSIGRGTERAAEKIGQAMHTISHPTGVILGTIAGTLGGWWRRAADRPMELPQAEDGAFQEHFSSLAAPPPGMTYEQARPGYELGYTASRNPSYQGREFDEVDPELRSGFGDQTEQYDSIREFTRYGYERGNSSGDGSPST